MEFWCMVIAYDPNPSTNENKPRLLKEFLIKFTVMNGKKPLTLNLNTFTISTGLDYNNGVYVPHASPGAVKAELAKIVMNLSYLDKTPVLKNLFPVAWRIMLPFVIQVDMGEIIYSDLVTKLLNKSRLRYVSYLRYIFCALEALLGLEYTQDEKISPYDYCKQLEGFSVSTSFVCKEKEREVLDYLERNIQLASTGLPSTLDESTRKSQPFPKGTTTDPKDSGGNDQPADKGLPSTTSNKGMAKTMSRPKGPLKDKDSGGNKRPADMEPINPTIFDPSGTGAKYQESQILKPYNSKHLVMSKTCYSLMMKWFKKVMRRKCLRLENTWMRTLRKVSRVLFNRLTEAQWAQHEEVVVFYADLKDAIKGNYKENINHMEQTDKVIDAVMNSFDKNSIARGDLLNAVNGVTETLKAVQDVVKEDLVLNKKVLEATKAHTMNSTHLTELLALIKNLDFQGLKYLSLMTEIYQSFKGQSSAPSSSVPQITLAITEGPANIQAHLDKKEKIKKAVEEAKLFKMTKIEVIKKNNSIVKDLMTSLGKRYERLKKIPEELGIQSALPALVPRQVISQSLGRKRKHIELEPEIKVPRWNDIHKVGVDSLVSELVMALVVKTQENSMFGLKLRKLIVEHPDQEKLQSKKVKLEAL
nr:hypothetical protein [Tanacetum cinerariifolium]